MRGGLREFFAGGEVGTMGLKARAGVGRFSEEQAAAAAHMGELVGFLRVSWGKEGPSASSLRNRAWGSQAVSWYKYIHKVRCMIPWYTMHEFCTSVP